MKKTELTSAIEKVVEVKMKAVDKLVEELVEPLADIGNPEQLIKKPYEQWTGQDLQLLIKIYGQGDNTPLSNLVFRKEFEKVKALEAEEEK